MTTTPKKALTVPAQVMKEIGLKEKELIRQDSLKGIGQDIAGTKWGNYLSNSYKKYKANYMNRFTSMNGEKRKHNIGTKLKSLRGQAVVSNETAFVNMTLTGQMANGLHIESVSDNAVLMSYLPKDAGKVIGNRELGREVVGLNGKNIELIKDIILSEFNKGIDEWCREDIVVNISI